MHRYKGMFGDSNLTLESTRSVRLNLNSPLPQVFREAFHLPDGIHAGAAMTRAGMAPTSVELSVHSESVTTRVFIHRMGIEPHFIL